MKRVLSILLLLALPLLATAQTKVLERSSKKAPAWLVSSGNDYFVACANAPTLDEAKELCIQDVKKQIISAVAENIKGSTSQTLSQKTAQNGIIDFLDAFDAKFETRSAVLPFVNGISMSKVEGYYYEKILDRESYTTSYLYNILYPFSSRELQQLIDTFMAQDTEMEGILNEQIKKSRNISSTEDIDRGIAALTPLLDYFFDDLRISKTEQAIAQFKKLYSYVTVELVSSSPGEMLYVVLIDGRPITTAIKPTFRSNSAMGLMYTNVGDGTVLVTYDSEGCSPMDNNFIEVNYRLPYNPIKKQLFPTMTKSPLRVLTTGEMIIELVEDSSTNEISGVEIEFHLDNRSEVSGELKSLTLQIVEFDSTINISDLNIALPQGVTTISIPCSRAMNLKNRESNGLSFTQGSASIINSSNGEQQRVPIVVKYTIK